MARHRASVLETQVLQLDSAVNQHLPGRLQEDRERRSHHVRVRLSAEARGLLHRLRESRDIRVQQQLVRALTHQVTRDITRVIRRSKAVQAARKRAASAWRWFRSGAARQVARGWERARETRPGRAARTAGTRSRAVSRTRQSRAAERVTRAMGERPGRRRGRPVTRAARARAGS
jgi:hypothetical protein